MWQRSLSLLPIALAAGVATTHTEITAAGGAKSLAPVWPWSHDEAQQVLDLHEPSAAIGLAAGKHGNASAQPPSGNTVIVISSWLMMTLMGSGPFTDPAMNQKELENIAESVRTALAEILVVCRAAVHVTDMSSNDKESSLMQALQARRAHKPWKPQSQVQNEREEMHAPSAKLAQLLRRSNHISEDAFSKMNFTRIKTSYEIRVFPEMRVPPKEVVSRIDRLQIFSRFADLNHVIVRNVIHRSDLTKLADGVMLDDVGYAVRELKQRSSMTTGQVLDCTEEGLLQDAREVHQYVIAFCCAIVLIITCAGSAIFSLKQPSVVPSRMNPLLALSR